MKWVLNNSAVKLVYKLKFYMNITFGEIGWVMSKFPEIVSVGILLKWFGLNFTQLQVILVSPVIFVAVILFGYVWRKLGMYDVEQYVNAQNNPVQNELLLAARKINREEKVK